MVGSSGTAKVTLPTDEDAPVTTVTLTEVDGRTILTELVQTSSKELRDVIINSGMEVGLQQAFDRLEEVAVSLR